MPEEPHASDPDDQVEVARERAIVEESIAALRGEATTATDHERDRRRVRTVIAAIEQAR